MLDEEWNAVLLHLTEYGFILHEIDRANLQIVVKIGAIRDESRG